MGNTGSLFYPDNPKRYRRAEELSNDCKYAQNQYEESKRAIENELGPYKAKLDKVLKAFNCRDIDDFDRLILRTATGEALDHWGRVRNNYDKSQIVDQVIMGAEGVVVIVGLTVSVIGAVAGGFGFFAGLGVTADILLGLGLLGALYDIINGAIQRSKLREAINELFPTRIKARYAAMQMQQLEKCIPSIKKCYEIYEKCHFDLDQIIEQMREDGVLDSLKEGSSKITYHSVAEKLAAQDSSRQSWTDEDPSWRDITSHLDSPPRAAAFGAASAADSSHRIQLNLASPKAESKDGHVILRFVQDDVSPLLAGPIHVKLEEFEGDYSARVVMNIHNDRETLTAGVHGKSVSASPISLVENATKWVLSFLDPADAAAFVSLEEDLTTRQLPEAVKIHATVGGLYLTKDGLLSQHPAVLAVSYV